MKIKPIHIITLSILLLALDQISKIVIKTSMKLGEAIYVLGNWFQIRFIENPGAAYGMEMGGDYGKLALSLFRILAIGGLVWFVCRLYKKQAPTGVIVAFTMVLIGALGNMVDSAFYGLVFTESNFDTVSTFTSMGQGYGTFLHGNVVDMLYFPIIDIAQMPDWFPIWGGERFIFFSPIFNLADSYICIALAYLIIFQRKFFDSKSQPEIDENY